MLVFFLMVLFSVRCFLIMVLLKGVCSLKWFSFEDLLDVLVVLMVVSFCVVLCMVILVLCSVDWVCR